MNLCGRSIEKKKIVLAVISIVIAACVYFAGVQRLHKQNHANVSESYTLQDFEYQGAYVSTDGKELFTNTDDAGIKRDIGKIYADEVVVRLDREMGVNWKLQLFYADEGEEFSEEKSIWTEVMPDEKNITVSVQREISRLRIDFGEEEGRTYAIDSIEINPTVESSMSSFKIGWLMIIVVAFCIYGMLNFSIYVYKRGREEQQSEAMGGLLFVCGMTFFYLSVCAIILGYSDKLQENSFWKSDLVGTVCTVTHDLDGEEGHYQVVGDDPFAVYEIRKDNYARGIVYFDEMPDNKYTFYIYYASDADGFSENNKIICALEEGKNYITFNLPRKEALRYIRVDYEMTGVNKVEAGQKFAVKSVDAVRATILTDIHGSLTSGTVSELLAVTIGYIFLIWGYCVKRDTWNRLYENIKLRSTVEIIAIVVLPVILFWDYLSGKTCFVFSDVAQDSIGQYYPAMLHMTERVSKGQWTDVFSFVIGLGNPENSIIPNLYNWVALFGKDKVAYLFGVSIFLKVMLSGLLAYMWASLFELKNADRLIIALGYEFNAMLIVRSCWEAYPNVALMIMFWLVCFELVYRKRKKSYYLLFALASELFFLQFDIYYCVLYGFIFLVYICCRVLSDGSGIKETLKIGGLCYFPFAFFGVADALGTSFVAAVSSNRVSTGAGYVAAKLSSYLRFRWKYLYDAFERSIGQAIQGVSGDFCGIDNILEGPAFYCGILILILIPVAFYNLPKKKKPLFILGFLATFLYITVPFVRALAAGFAGESFKYSSFWIVVLAVLNFAEAASEVQKHGLRKKSLVIFNITSAIVLILLISLLFCDKIARMNQWWASVIYVLMYTMCINLIYIYHVKFARLILVGALMTEGLILSFNVVNNRETLSKTELDALFYDDAYDSIHKVVDSDDSWYRIEKFPLTVSLSDSWAQDYRGTASYVGGAEIGAGVLSYYTQLGLPRMGTHWLYGTNGNLYANSLLGVKYIFSESQSNFRYGVHYKESNKKVDVYENDLTLPIAYFYDDQIGGKDFERLSYLDRNRELLKKCVVYDKNYKAGNTVPERPEFDSVPVQFDFQQTNKITGLENTKGKVIVLDIQYDEKKDENLYYGEVYCKGIDGKEHRSGFSLFTPVEIYAENEITEIRFNARITGKIKTVDVYIYDADDYYSDTVSDIEKLQKNGMKDVAFGDYEITGNIHAPVDGVLATSIPFNQNWKIFVDGNEGELLQVNTGFIGADISEGEHEIRLYYEHKSWLAANKFKCIGFGVIIITGAFIAVDEIRKKYYIQSNEVK